MDGSILDLQVKGWLATTGLIVRRGGARLIDLLVLGVLGWFVLRAIPLAPLGDHGWVIGWLIVTLYDTFSHSKWGGGATIGKWIFGLRVVDVDGAGLKLHRAFLRSLAFSVMMISPSLGAEFRYLLPSNLGTAAHFLWMAVFLGWSFGTPLLFATVYPARSYCDLFGSSICLPRRQIAMLGLPRHGVKLFGRSVADEEGQRNPNLFTVRSAMIHQLWAIPLLTFALVGTFTEPIKNQGADVQHLIRTAAVARNLPISHIVVERFGESSDSVLVSGRVHATLSKLPPRELSRALDNLQIAFWNVAAGTLPGSVAPDKIEVELRDGPDLGFSSQVATYRRGFLLHLAQPDTAAASQEKPAEGDTASDKVQTEKSK